MAQPEVPVFDCNAALGRLHNQRVAYDTRDDLLRMMSESGIAKAVVYNPYCLHFGTVEGNQFLLEAIGGDQRLIAQFVVNFATDEISEIDALVRQSGIRSLRVVPATHRYPLVHWIADPWLEWMAQERMALWIPMSMRAEADARDLYETAKRHPKVPVVLAGAHYNSYPVVWPLVKALDHLYVDTSRFDLLDGINRLLQRAGPRRILFGSDFPDVDPRPYLHYLRRCGLSNADLEAICGGNLQRLIFAEG
ncbi:MAG: hypothetical protein FJW26_16300 [Acidimicrobiia bacterium]|nr:hypothetical protein [Acidimicrobiia bacterium]